MRFSYVGYQVETTPAQRGLETVYRPIIPVRLVGSQAEVRIRGLLDTGADETLLTREMADAIGLSPIPGETGRILSAGGEVPLVYASLELEVTLGPDRMRWPATVGIVERAWDEALLGFRGFLEYFDASFFGHSLELELTRNTRPFLN